MLAVTGISLETPVCILFAAAGTGEPVRRPSLTCPDSLSNFAFKTARCSIRKHDRSWRRRLSLAVFCLAWNGKRRGPASPTVSKNGTVTPKAVFLFDDDVRKKEREGHSRGRPAVEGGHRSGSSLATLSGLPRQFAHGANGNFASRNTEVHFFFLFGEGVHVWCLSVFVGGDGFMAFFFITVLKCEPWGRRHCLRRSEHHLRPQRHSRRSRRCRMPYPLLATWSSRSRRLRRCRRTGRPRAAGS